MLQTYLILHLLLLFLAYSNLSCHAFSAGCSPTGASIRRNNKIYPSHHIILHSSTRTADETDQFNVDKVPSSTTTANEKQRPSQRRISQTEKFARLPVWPVSIFTYLFFQCILMTDDKHNLSTCSFSIFQYYTGMAGCISILCIQNLWTRNCSRLGG